MWRIDLGDRRALQRPICCKRQRGLRMKSLHQETILLQRDISRVSDLLRWDLPCPGRTRPSPSAGYRCRLEVYHRSQLLRLLLVRLCIRHHYERYRNSCDSTLSSHRCLSFFHQFHHPCRSHTQLRFPILTPYSPFQSLYAACINTTNACPSGLPIVY